MYNKQNEKKNNTIDGCDNMMEIELLPNEMVIDGITVNPKRITEYNFISELKYILRTDFNNINTDTYWSFKQWYIMIEPKLQQLRRKYNLSENPPGTNTEIILQKSVCEYKQYTVKMMMNQQVINDYYAKTLNSIDELFNKSSEYNSQYYKYHLEHIPPDTIKELKEEIIQDYNLDSKRNQPHLLLQCLDEIRKRFS